MRAAHPNRKKSLAGQWGLRPRFPDHDSLDDFDEIYLETDISMAVEGIDTQHATAIEDHPVADAGDGLRTRLLRSAAVVDGLIFDR